MKALSTKQSKLNYGLYEEPLGTMIGGRSVSGAAPAQRRLRMLWPGPPPGRSAAVEIQYPDRLAAGAQSILFEPACKGYAAVSNDDECVPTVAFQIDLTFDPNGVGNAFVHGFSASLIC